MLIKLKHICHGTTQCSLTELKSFLLSQKMKWRSVTSCFCWTACTNKTSNYRIHLFTHHMSFSNQRNVILVFKVTLFYEIFFICIIRVKELIALHCGSNLSYIQFIV